MSSTTQTTSTPIDLDWTFYRMLDAAPDEETGIQLRYAYEAISDIGNRRFDLRDYYNRSLEDIKRFNRE